MSKAIRNVKSIRSPQHKPKKCTECGIYPADYPSKLCPGCLAYRDHQK